VLGILAFGNVDVAAAIVAAGALPPLVELLRSGSDEVKMCAAKVLGRDLADTDIDIAAAVVAAGAMSPLVELLYGGSDAVKKYASPALVSLGLGKPVLAAAIVRAGGHDPILSAI
jgi:vacuolar protein 8